MTPRRRFRRPFAAALALVVVLLAGKGAAQSADPAQALTLFKRGRDALAQKDYEGACVAFAESQKLDARVGTLLNLADCEEHLDRLALAFTHWQQAIDRAAASGDDRVDYLRQRFAALAPRVPTLKITREASSPPGAVVRRDQVEVGPGSLGQEIPVDPGHHEIEVSADGFFAKRYEVDLVEGAHEAIEVNVGAPEPPAPPPPTAVTAEPSPLPARPAPTWTTQKTLAVASAGVGVAGLGVGIVAGITALAKQNDATSTPHCTSGGACDSPVALAQWNATRGDAQTAAAISTAAFVVGGVGLATGVVLWLTAAPKAARPAPARIGLGVRSVNLWGEW